LQRKAEKVSNKSLPEDGQELGFGNAYKRNGRRVVKLDLLAKLLDSGCKTCAEPLKLSNTTDEMLSGIGSLCCNPDCGEINVWHTQKTHRVVDTLCRRPIFDNNTKLVVYVG